MRHFPSQSKKCWVPLSPQGIKQPFLKAPLYYSSCEADKVAQTFDIWEVRIWSCWRLGVSVLKDWPKRLLKKIASWQNEAEGTREYTLVSPHPHTPNTLVSVPFIFKQLLSADAFRSLNLKFQACTFLSVLHISPIDAEDYCCDQKKTAKIE